jgi:hypothetical protein
MSDEEPSGAVQDLCRMEHLRGGERRNPGFILPCQRMSRSAQGCTTRGTGAPRPRSPSGPGPSGGTQVGCWQALSPWRVSLRL